MAFVTQDEKIQFSCLFGVFVIWFVTLIPIRMAQRRAPKYDNSQPREQYNQLDAAGRRAVACSNNTAENLIFFIAALLTCRWGNGDLQISTIFSLMFLGCRAVYPVMYWMDLPTLRSFVWLTSLIPILGLFILPFAT